MAEDSVNISALAEVKMMDNCSCSNIKVDLISPSQAVWQCSLCYVQVVTQVQFFCEGLGIPCVGLLGLLGNVAAIIVLRSVKSSVPVFAHLQLGKQRNVYPRLTQ